MCKFDFLKWEHGHLCNQLLTVNPLSTNPTKWSNTLKHFVGKWLVNCLSVFDHFVKLALKGLNVQFKFRNDETINFSHKFWNGRQGKKDAINFFEYLKNKKSIFGKRVSIFHAFKVLPFSEIYINTRHKL